MAGELGLACTKKDVRGKRNETTKIEIKALTEKNITPP